MGSQRNSFDLAFFAVRLPGTRHRLLDPEKALHFALRFVDGQIELWHNLAIKGVEENE
jgi:hypothetical protein